MNVSRLSAVPFPPAAEPIDRSLPQEQDAPASRSTSRAVETSEIPVEDDVEATADVGDFNDLLAAMMSLTATPVEAPIETGSTSTTAASTTAISTGSDVPRDGAGSPLLLGTNFTSFANAAATSAPSAVSEIATTDSLASQAPAASTTTTVAEIPAPATGVPIADASASAELEQALAALPVPESGPEATELSVDAPAVNPDAPLTSDTETKKVDLPIVATSTEDSVDEPATPAIASRSATTTTPATSGTTTTRVETVESSAATQPVASSDAPEQTTERPTTAASEKATDAKPVATSNPSPAHPAVRTKSTDAQPTAQEQVAVASDKPGVIAEPNETPSEAPPTAASAAPRKSSGASKAVPNRVAPQTAAAEVVTEGASVAMNVALTPVTAQTGIAERDVLREDKVSGLEAAGEKPVVAQQDLNSLSTLNNTASETAAAQKTSATFAATLTDNATASTPSHVSQQVAQALAAYEAELPSSGSKSFQLLLDPPELGRLLIQMSRSSKGVSVRIAAENETVQAMLETTGAELQQTLQLSNFDLGGFGGSPSNSSGESANEFVFAPTLQSFASGSRSTAVSPAATSSNSAVNVVV